MLFTFGEFKMDKEPDDADLVKRLKSGEAEALRELEIRYKWKVVRLAERFGVGNDAADVWQDVCLRVEELKNEAALGAFVHRTAVNLCIDASEKRIGVTFLLRIYRQTIYMLLRITRKNSYSRKRGISSSSRR